MTDPLDRIAAALERLSPPPGEAADPLAHPAYLWRTGHLAAARQFGAVPLGHLRGIDAQRDALLGTLRHLAARHAAHDALLWGARGTGKSALVKSAVAAVQAEGAALALIEVAAGALDGLPPLFDLIAHVPRSFAIFIDDLAFETPADARSLRSLLEGGAEARPDNVRLVVTSNRRHLMPRDMADQASAINPRDGVDDQLALADRFGLSLGFHAIDQDGYLAIVRHYADHFALPFDAADALLWAAQRGARSGRVAWHHIVDVAGRTGRTLSPSTATEPAPASR